MNIPPLNAVGAFELAAPFTIDDSKAWSCEALETYQALVDKGVNVFADYYQPHSLPLETYSDHLKNHAVIVTLLSSDGTRMSVPSPYVIKYPIRQLVPYSNLIMTVHLGMLPDSENLDALATSLKTYAEDFVGHSCEVELHQAPIVGFVDEELDVSLRAAREANTQYLPNKERELRETQAELTRAREHIAALEALLTQP